MAWDYYGNQWAVDMLREQVIRSAARHAYIFAGPRGTGRRTLALRFLQAINCPKADQGNPCRKCAVCRQIESMQYSDLLVLQKPEDKNEIIKEQVDAAQHFLSLSPFQSSRKAVLLLDFQDSNPSSQSGLLKTLEETPGSALILITVDNVENLLPTTVSRCQLISLRPARTAEVASSLQENYRMESDKADLLAHISGGRYGYAMRLAEDSALLEQRETRIEDWIAINSMSRLE